MSLPEIRSAHTEHAWYLMENGVRRWVDLPARIILETDAATVRALPVGEPLCDLDFIRDWSGFLASDGGERFWVIENREKRKIEPPGEAGVVAAGRDLAGRVDLPASYLDQIPDGPVIDLRPPQLPPKEPLPYRNQLAGDISPGWYVDSSGYLTAGGQAYVDVYLRSTSVWGFHAGVVTLFLDHEGRVLDMREFNPGVSGASKVFLPGQRPGSDALWDVDASVVAATYSLKQVHYHKPKWMLAENLRAAIRVGQTIQEFVDEASQIPWVKQAGAAILV